MNTLNIGPVEGSSLAQGLLRKAHELGMQQRHPSSAV